MLTTRRDRFDKLQTEVVESGGVLEVQMGTLRDLYGAGRAGHLVRADVEKLLGAREVGHLPAELPIDHRHKVVLYSTQASAGQLIAAALKLSRLETNGGEPA